MEDLRTRIKDILENDKTEDYDNSVEQIGNLFNSQLLAWLAKIKLPHGDIYNQNDMYEAYKAGEVQSHDNDYIQWLDEYTTCQKLIVDPKSVPALQNKVTSLECEIADLKNRTALRKIDGSTYYILVPSDKYQSFQYDSDKVFWIDKECIVVSIDEFMIEFAKWMAAVPDNNYTNQLWQFKLKYDL